MKQFFHDEISSCYKCNVRLWSLRKNSYNFPFHSLKILRARENERVSNINILLEFILSSNWKKEYIYTIHELYIELNLLRDPLQFFFLLSMEELKEIEDSTSPRISPAGTRHYISNFPSIFGIESTPAHASLRLEIIDTSGPIPISISNERRESRVISPREAWISAFTVVSAPWRPRKWRIHQVSHVWLTFDPSNRRVGRHSLKLIRTRDSV